MPKRCLGFVDHVLDNWHANVFVEAVRNQLKPRGFEVTGCTASDPVEGRAWAEKHNVPYFDSVGHMDQHVDAYMVLAPSNPELHLEMCRQVLPFGKPTFVDKTFAPRLAVAKAIFALADQYGAVLQTSSALRYTNVQTAAAKMGTIEHMVAWGPGRSFGEYAIHPVEMIVSCMGADAQSVLRRGTNERSQLLINYNDGRTAVANIYCGTETAYAASLTDSKQTMYAPVDTSVFYICTLSAILDFIEAEKPNVPREQSLMIRRILDAAESQESSEGFVSVNH